MKRRNREIKDKQSFQILFPYIYILLLSLIYLILNILNCMKVMLKRKIVSNWIHVHKETK